MTQDWLKNLKADDYVFISSRRRKRLTRVQKITPTGRVVVDNIQFINGANRSNKWTLEEATTESVEKYKAIQFIRAVKLAMNNTKMTYKQAQEINEILNLGIGE